MQETNEEKINKTEGCLFKYINKNDEPLAKLKEKRDKTSIANIRNDEEDLTMYPIDGKRNVRSNLI